VLRTEAIPGLTQPPTNRRASHDRISHPAGPEAFGGVGAETQGKSGWWLDWRVGCQATIGRRGYGSRVVRKRAPSVLAAAPGDTFLTTPPAEGDRGATPEDRGPGPGSTIDGPC